jgi:hypothetical protein
MDWSSSPTAAKCGPRAGQQVLQQLVLAGVGVLVFVSNT